MDPLSIAAGVAGLISLALQVSQSLKTYSTTALHSRQDITSLLKEIETTHSVLQQLYPFLGGAKTGAIVFQHGSALQIAVETCEGVVKDLGGRLGRLEGGKGLRVGLEMLKWPFSEKEVGKVVQVLGRCTATFHFALTVEGCKVLSQTNAVARASLEVQLANSRQVVELSQTVATLQHLAEEASRTSTDLLSMIELLQGVQISRSEVQELRNGVSMLTLAAQESRLQEMLDWLSPPHHSQKHQEIRKRRVTSTGQWLLQNQNFCRWSSKEISTLICTGGPGVGKSILTSLVIDESQKEIPRKKEVALAYYYFDYRTPDLQTPEAFIASILRQLLSQSISFPKEFRAFYDRYRDAGALHYPTQLWSLLRDVMESFETCHVIIDAFDECFNPLSRRSILKELGNCNKAKLQLLITSRPHCFDLPNDSSMTTISINAHDDDIRTYIEASIEASENAADIFDAELKATCVSEISMHAKGMFLLVFLQTQAILEAITRSEVRKHLQSLTKDLGEAFQNTLQRINRQSAGRRIAANRTLTWVSRAFRPLRIDELCHLLATEIGDELLDQEAVLKPKQVLESCFGLVYIDDSTQNVRLVHLALQEYLQKEELGAKEGWDADTYITGTLLTYLAFGDLETNWHGRLSTGVLRYARLCWGLHAKVASASLIDHLALAYLNTKRFHHCDIRIQILQITRLGKFRSTSRHWALERYPYKATGLHVAAAFGLPRLIGSLLDGGSNIHAKDGAGDMPLHLAVANEHLTSTSLLLERGADPNQQNNRWRSPLYEAVVVSNEVILQELLSYHAAVNIECDDRWSPLHKAADNNDQVLVNILLKEGASVTSTSFRGLVPLHRAAGKGDTAIMKALISAGTPVDSRTHDGWSPLHGASNGGHVEAVQLLLSLDAQVYFKDVDGRTPLHRAARHGHVLVITTLLGRGADTLSPDYRGGIPLHRAAKGGHVAVIDILLGHADGPAVSQLVFRNDEGMTPREHAAHQGQWRVAQELRIKEETYKIIEPSVITLAEKAVNFGDLSMLKEAFSKGADSAQTTSEGFSLFHLALIQEHEDMARYLSKLPGIDLEAKTSEGWQALHCAANTGNSSLVRLCLDHDPDISSRTNIGETALNKACRSGNLDSVKILVEAGASINVADNWGWTPLHKAALSGSMPIVELLIQQKADYTARTKKQATPQISANDAGKWQISQYLRQLRQEHKGHAKHSGADVPFGKPKEKRPSGHGSDLDVEDLERLSDPTRRLTSITSNEAVAIDHAIAGHP